MSQARVRFDRKLFLGVSMAALLAPVSVQAQGASRAFDGLYVGVHGGYGGGTSDLSCDLGGCVGDMNTSGGFVGGQIGFNKSYGGLILGIEGDVAFTNIEGDAFFTGKNATSELDWMATLRARAGGVVMDGTMAYVTAGIAWGAWNDSGSIGAINASASDVRTGFTVGGGFETKLSQSMSLKLEYLFVDFGSASQVVVVPTHFDHEIHTIKIGINFKLN